MRFDAFEATELQTKNDVSIEISIGVASKDCKKTKVEVIISWNFPRIFSQFYI